MSGFLNRLSKFVVATLLVFTACDQAFCAISGPTIAPGYKNSLGLGFSGNVGNQDSKGFGLSLVDYSRHIQGRWSITLGLGYDKKWTEKTEGTERTTSYSLTSTLGYDVTKLTLFGTPSNLAVFGGMARDVASHNEETGNRNEDLGTSVGGGLSFSIPLADRWSLSLTPLMALELSSSELSLEFEFSGAYSF